MEGRGALLQEYDEQKQTATFAIYVMVLMISGHSAITVVDTLASSVSAQRRGFGLQMLAGCTRAR